MSLVTTKYKHNYVQRSCCVLLAKILLLSGLGFSAVAQAEEKWQELDTEMVGVKNYFRERCMKFKAGDTVEFRFMTLHPLDFNVHYHPANSTIFLIEQENLTAFSGEFFSQNDDSYCFTWTNNAELDAETWSVTLEYRVTPK